MKEAHPHTIIITKNEINSLLQRGELHQWIYDTYRKYDNESMLKVQFLLVDDSN